MKNIFRTERSISKMTGVLAIVATFVMGISALLVFTKPVVAQESYSCRSCLCDKSGKCVCTDVVCPPFHRPVPIGPHH